MSEPRVSVLLPVYNGARYLRPALESIRAQTLEDFECVIVDDGSTDNSRAIAEGFAATDKRFRVLSRANTGIVGALNDGLSLCKTKYIARMDADDIALPERLVKQADFLDTHPDCVGVGAWVLFTDPCDRPLLHFQPDTTWSAIQEKLRTGNVGGLIHPAMMLRRDAVQAVGGYLPEAEWVEDFDLFLRLSERGELAILPEILLRYRQHPQSVNRTRNASERRQRKQRSLEADAQRRDVTPVTLPELSPSCDTDRQWAYWAAQDGYFRSAFHWSLKHLGKHLGDREAWRCFNYTLKRALGLIPAAPERS